MKNLFESETVEEVLGRINQLQPATQGQWGKMDVAQMMAHCSLALDMASGCLNPPRMFIGRVLGPLVKPIYTNEKPFSKNNPTDKKLLVADQRDFGREQERLCPAISRGRGVQVHAPSTPVFRTVLSSRLEPRDVQASGSSPAAVWGMTRSN